MQNLKLPTLEPETAAARGYVEITVPISMISEMEIINSIDHSLSTCDACWIKSGKNHLEAGRKNSDLKKINE